MAGMTDRFYREIRRSHTMVSYVDVVGPDLETIRIPAIEGGVDVDRTAAIRRKCDVKCVDPEGLFVPKDESGILTPYGTEIRPYRGIIYDDGTEEICPLGVFRLSKADIRDSSGKATEISLEGYDRSRTISRDKFVVPYVIEEGTNLMDALKQIIQRTFPDAEYDAITTTVTTTGPLLYDAGDDPWEACMQLASSMGCEVYFDVVGRVAVHPPVDISALPAPDFTYVEGQGCTMIDLARVFTDEPGFNGVIVTGESAGDEEAPVRGEAWDEEPSSPTYRFGPYGEVPTFITDSNVTTTDEATQVALAELANVLGSSVQLSITATVNPSYEAGEVVEVKRARSGVSGLYALDAFNVPLGRDSTQGLTLRQRRVVSG